MNRRKNRKGRKPQPDMPPVITVDNPQYEPGNPESIQRVTLPRFLRDDPLGQMHARGQLDTAQYEAGRRVQADYGCRAICIRGQDTTQEPVDGGGGHTRRQRAQMRCRPSHALGSPIGCQGLAVVQAGPDRQADCEGNLSVDVRGGDVIEPEICRATVSGMSGYAGGADGVSDHLNQAGI